MSAGGINDIRTPNHEDTLCMIGGYDYLGTMAFRENVL